MRNQSALTGSVTADYGSDAGGSVEWTAATFTSCTGLFGATTVAATSGSLPWSWSTDGTGAGTFSGMDVTIMESTFTCRYTGSISPQYDAADWGGNGDAVLSGSLTRLSGTSSACPTTSTVSGTYNIVGPNGVIDL